MAKQQYSKARDSANPHPSIAPTDINPVQEPFEAILKRPASGDMIEPLSNRRRKYSEVDEPDFSRLKRSDPQLRSLGVFPDEILVEICKYLVPPEVTEIAPRQQTDKTPRNSLNLMRASRKIYNMMRELECFNQRTYTITISGRGYFFEGNRGCHPSAIGAAMKHVRSIRLLVEIDLGGLIEVSWFKSFNNAMVDAWEDLRHLMNRRLERYDIEVYVTDFKYVLGEPPFRPSYFANRDFVGMEGVLRNILTNFLKFQNTKVGNVQLMSKPLTYHPHWNCSGSLATRTLALEKWHKIQMVVDAAAYALSGWDEQELLWCGRFLRIPFFDQYKSRTMGMIEAPGSQHLPVYDNMVTKRCRCQPNCFHII
jgi:hypothetical protein